MLTEPFIEAGLSHSHLSQFRGPSHFDGKPTVWADFVTAAALERAADPLTGKPCPHDHPVA
jgi:hypothetical protein